MSTFRVQRVVDGQDIDELFESESIADIITRFDVDSTYKSLIISYLHAEESNHEE